MDFQYNILQSMTSFMEKSGGITGGHMERTGRYVALFLDMLKWKNTYIKSYISWDKDSFIRSAVLHDLGKISIRNSIIYKPGKLTSSEFEEMKRHTLSGIEVIEALQKHAPLDKYLEYAKILIGTHHEWWDGSGYPKGLKGRQIPLQGRIMAIIDVYDALISERPYKRPYTHEEAMVLILEGRGSHFEPALVDLFLSGSRLFKQASHLAA